MKPPTAMIGIDIGGTKTRLDLFNSRYEIVAGGIFLSRPDKGDKHFFGSMDDILDDLRAKAKAKRLEVRAVGVGCSGHVDTDSGLIRSSPLPFLVKFPLKKYLTRKTRVGVMVGNDVHLGVYGEHQLGAAKGAANIVGVFIGTGIGAALIIDGKLYRGAGGRAGDIGHYLMAPIGPLAGSERAGVLDDYASGSAIAGAAASLAVRQQAPNLFKSSGTDVRDIRSSALAEAIESGDRSVEELIRKRARMTGIVLSNVVDLLNPEMVVLGGGLVERMPNLFLKEVRQGIHAHAVSEVVRRLRICVAKLKGHAVTAGAALMAAGLLSGGTL